MSTQFLTVALDTIECPTCHLLFAVTADWVLARRRDHLSFWCPNGHKDIHFPGESDLEKAERLRKTAERSRDDGWAAYTASQDQLRATQRSKAALKGQLTRIRNKVANGVCPVGGCRRHFDNVQAHIATQHPTWSVIDPETGKAAVL